MGRLFWKILAGFWVTLLLGGLVTGSLLHVLQQRQLKEMDDVAHGPRARMAVEMMGKVLRHGGPEAARDLLRGDRRLRHAPLLIVDRHGRELLDRPVPREALEEAKELSRERRRRAAARRVERGKQRYLVFIPGNGHGPGGHSRLPPPPYARWIILGVASLLFSALLAWYITRPLRSLRRASQRLAAGDLDARVLADMGNRHDEIGDLGRDFDDMAERLQELVSSQRRLLHDVSHELRSPLARLQLALGLARQKPRDLEAALVRIEREGQRLDRLVGEVLTLARLESGVKAGEPDLVDFLALISTIVDDVRFEAEERGVTVDFDPPQRGELLVSAQGELLHRAIENVLRNAVRFSPEGGRVSLVVGSGEDGVCLAIADQGRGLPEDQLQRMFEPFRRGTEESGGEGFGLGLAIARRAIEAHGGVIEARNRAEGGLRVELCLPPDIQVRPESES